MKETLDFKNIGLRGVKVADTRISDVDGEKGMLVYRGFNVVDLAQFSTFEEVSFLLLNDHLPTREELKDFQSELVPEREIPKAVLRCLEMLLEIEEVNRVQSWVSERLQKGGKIMGMGHAVYHTEDPRAAILRRICERMADRFPDLRWCELSKTIEAATKEGFRRLKGKEIYSNVDFFSAPVYHMMRIPRDLFTPVFAISRSSGWSAHIIEEKFGEAQPKPELYRPDADYIGNYCGLQGCEYIPIEERSR